jgi:hypothetical protein
VVLKRNPTLLRRNTAGARSADALARRGSALSHRETALPPPENAFAGLHPMSRLNKASPHRAGASSRSGNVLHRLKDVVLRFNPVVSLLEIERAF